MNQYRWDEEVQVPCSIIRGGTSKGIFFLENDLPSDLKKREEVILRIFGSPDQRQIDGLAGANSLTSKTAIVGPSLREDADVDYTFGQVVITEPKIDWVGNCGNISSGVGLFAVNEGLVKAVEPVTTVRIYNANTGKLITAQVPVKNGRAVSKGDYRIPGVPSPGAKIELTFTRPDGSVTGKLLPTGNASDTITLTDGRVFTVSIVDAANPVVFVRAHELGLKGTELPIQVEQMPEILAALEEIRSRAAQTIGLVKQWQDATKEVPAIPKIGFVSPAQDFVNPEGEMISKETIDFTARLASVQKMHRAYMVTGAICTAVAANIPGTVVNEVLAQPGRLPRVCIGQPYGPMDVNVQMSEGAEGPVPGTVTVGRTARRLLKGAAFVPRDLFETP